MMNVIFDVIGTPTPADIEAFKREDSKQYINLFAQRVGVGIRSKFQWADPVSIDLLEKMLRFDASSRISDDDALAHPVFTDIREPAKEGDLAPCKLVMDFDRELAETMPKDVMEQKLRNLLAEQVARFSAKETIGNQGQATGYESSEQPLSAPA